MTIISCHSANSENIVPNLSAPESSPLKMADEKQDTIPREGIEEATAEAVIAPPSDDVTEKDDSASANKTHPTTEVESHESKKEELEDVEQSGNEEEQDIGSGEEAQGGVLDQPLVVEGKRHRSSVQRLAMTPVASPKPHAGYKGGTGVSLGSIDYVCAQIEKHRAAELKTMYRVLFGTTGKQATVKKEIRAFNGFDFSENSADYTKRMAMLHKLMTSELKVIKEVLGLHVHGTSVKEALITVLVQFLMNPHDHKRKVIKKRKKSSSTKASGASKAKRTKKTTDEAGDEEGGESSSGESSDNDSDGDTGEQPAAEKAAPTPKASKPKAAPKTPKSAKKPTKDSDDDAESTARPPQTPKSSKKASVGKKAKAAAKKDEPEDSDSDGSSDDENEADTNKPSEVEVVDMIKKLLDTFDLSQVSMKEMCKAVIEKFPGSDLEERKSWLKDKIKTQLLG